MRKTHAAGVGGVRRQ